MSANENKKLNPISTNGLMRHLRNDCGIAISGSTAKRKLKQIGYYHGYKGYRFDLRNSVMHNNVILDARFSVHNKPSKKTGEFLGNEFGLQRINFEELADYVLIMTYFMSALEFTLTDRKRFINGFENVLEGVSKNGLPNAVTDRVIGRSYVLKVKAAKAFL